jgi:hypothetical protein
MFQPYRVWFCLDEDGEVMRSFRRKEEAVAWTELRQGWKIQCKTVTPKQTFIPEEAPF